MLAKNMSFLMMVLALAAEYVGGVEADDKLLAGRDGRPRPNSVLVMVDGRENEIFTRSQTFVNGMDIMSFCVAHAGGQEFLWQVNFYAAPDFEEGVFTFYLDHDLREDTGLKISHPVEEAVAPSAAAVRANGFDPPQALAGADLGVVFSRGQCRLLQWAPDGTAAEPRELPFLVKDKCLYFRTVMPTAPKNNKVSFAIAANAHSILTPERPRPAMRDTTRRAVIHRFALDPAMDSEAVSADQDDDGIPDAVEKGLGTDLARADRLTFQREHELMPEERRRQPGYDPGLDLVGYAAGHVAEDRFLFRLDFAAPPAGNGMYLIYLNTDSQAATGRRMASGTPIDGTDAAIACAVNGRPEGKSPLTLYGLTQEQCGDGHSAFAIIGNSLYFTADLPIAAADGQASFGMSVLVHTLGTGTVAMLDRTDPVQVAGLALRDGKKPVGGGNWNGAGELLRAGGLPLIRPLLHDPANVAIPFDKLELAGLDVDYFTNRQYGHLRTLRPLGSAGVMAPKGRYHVGFMMFDTRDGSRVGVRINDRDRASRMINAGNSDYWLYWEKDAYDFQGDEYVELVALGGMAPHPICYLLFLAVPPAPRELDCTVSDLLTQAVPETSGAVRLSWITANLAPTRLEYGIGDFNQVYSADKPMLVHRARLDNLRPGQEYQARGVGRDLAGNPVYGETVRFLAALPPPPATVAGRRQLVLTVQNEQEVPGRGVLLRSGIPFPRGQLSRLEHLRIMSGGQEIPSQFAVLARWPDQSFKAVMATFVGDVEAEAKAEYILEYGAAVQRQGFGLSLLADADAGAGAGVRLDSGKTQYVISPQGELLLGEGRPLRTRIRPLQGDELATGTLPASVEIEENGPVYARVKSTVAFPLAGDASTPRLSLVCRFEVWRGSPYLKLAHSVLVQGREQMSFFEDISLSIPWGASAWQASLAGGGSLSLAPGDRLFQRRSAEVIRNGGEPQTGRIVGNLFAGDTLVALRHCWEQYPKGIAVSENELRLELCPDFDAGFYDGFPFDWKSTKVHFCLQNGHYQFRRGMRKTHEILLGRGPDSAAAAVFCQRPLLATAPAEWYCRSGVFYDIAPRDTEAFPTYEANADHSFAGYRFQRENRDDFGLLNFGDWFGERGVHWGNSEYDNAVGFLLQYIRSGHVEAFHLGDEAEKHVRDVDVEHWVPDQGQAGRLYQHQVGHHGGHYQESPKGEEAIIWGSSSVSHAWTEGHLWYYFLRGDADSLAAGLSIADYFLDREFSRYYDFQDLRTPGWHLILDLAAYGANYDPAYLNAAKVIMRRIYAYQDKIPRPLPEHQLEPGRRTAQVGGWSRMMVPGHCHCEPRHRGNANFMLAVLLSGIKYYHAYTAEPEAKQCLIDGAFYFLDEVYSEEKAGIRYTSCPKMPFSEGAAPLLMEGIARAYLWTGDKRFLHPLTAALPLSERPSHYGSGYPHRCTPRVLADLQAAGLRWDSGKPLPTGRPGPFVKPDWLKKDDVIVVQAENFTDQGGGQCRVMGDRFGAWGKVVTYWHAELGHWLEWEVEVPADGDYVLRFHYATQTENTRRDILIDGVLPHSRAGKYHFPTTGGFGVRSTEWALLSFTDEAGQEIPLRLGKGRHAIRMVNRADGLAFDFMALAPVRP